MLIPLVPNSRLAVFKQAENEEDGGEAPEGGWTIKLVENTVRICYDLRENNRLVLPATDKNEHLYRCLTMAFLLLRLTVVTPVRYWL